MVNDHYIVAEEWRPNFEPGYSQVNNLRVWIRLPNLPVENFDPEILTLIGDKVGRTIRVDHTTRTGTRGNYARICVEVDLQKPLLSKYRLKRRVRRIEYEGLHVICYQCGCYGHEKEACPTLRAVDMKIDAVEGVTVMPNPTFQPSEVDPPRPELEEEYGPWMLAKKKTHKRAVIRGPTQSTTPVHDQSKTAKGSRFTVLTDEDVIHPIIISKDGASSSNNDVSQRPKQSAVAGDPSQPPSRRGKDLEYGHVTVFKRPDSSHIPDPSAIDETLKGVEPRLQNSAVSPVTEKKKMANDVSKQKSDMIKIGEGNSDKFKPKVALRNANKNTEQGSRSKVHKHESKVDKSGLPTGALLPAENVGTGV
ncbi:hypothetical protein LINPERHAP2_LOCUS29291 [Linum perenne]